MDNGAIVQIIIINAMFLRGLLRRLHSASWLRSPRSQQSGADVDVQRSLSHLIRLCAEGDVHRRNCVIELALLRSFPIGCQFQFFRYIRYMDSMFTVAIIGPDGAGKSTVISGLKTSIPYPMKYIYMGVNPEAMNHMLPTTRLVNFAKRALKKERGRAAASRSSTPGKQKPNRSGMKNTLRSIKSLLFIANRIGEEWYRQTVCWYHLRRGRLVLFDRHFYLDHLADIFANPNRERPALRRFHDALLERTYPRPDLTIYLDAPADVLYARKRESSIEGLQKKREAYLKMQEYVPNFAIVDASQPPDMVLQTVLGQIEQYRTQHGNSRRISSD